MPLCSACRELAETTLVGPSRDRVDHVEREYEPREGTCDNCGSAPVHDLVDETIHYEQREPVVRPRLREIFGYVARIFGR